MVLQLAATPIKQVGIETFYRYLSLNSFNVVAVF